MSQILKSSNTPDNLDPVAGWGEVPVEYRALWTTYMVDHLPWFPGVTVMALSAGVITNGGTHAPRAWKVTAQELHEAGFTPGNYYLLAELLKTPRFQAELDAVRHGHLFHTWFDAGKKFSTLRLAATAWQPWLERVARGESPRHALEHMLQGDARPALA